jgi:hypothetical protein
MQDVREGADPNKKKKSVAGQFAAVKYRFKKIKKEKKHIFLFVENLKASTTEYYH